MAGKSIGSRTWVIGDGYIPAWSNGPEPEMLSHESASMLNTGDTDAHVTLTIYHEEREPVGPYRITVPARRAVHQRFNGLSDPEPIPPGQGYAVVIESDQPIVVQHTRLDSRQAANTIFSTIAHPLD
jgi:hypothetical protein